jgi:hypothetical protein
MLLMFRTKVRWCVRSTSVCKFGEKMAAKGAKAC